MGWGYRALAAGGGAGSAPLEDGDGIRTSRRWWTDVRSALGPEDEEDDGHRPPPTPRWGGGDVPGPLHETARGPMWDLEAEECPEGKRQPGAVCLGE